MTIDLKKKLNYCLSVVLSLGSALTLGLLSFGGLYAIYPSIKYGLDSFLLASLYEGQIYFQNIRDAIRKLTDPNYFDNLLADDLITKVIDTKIQTLIAQITIKYKDELSKIDSEEEKEKFISEKLNKNKDKTAGLPLFFKDYHNAAKTLDNISIANPGSIEEEKAQERLELLRHYFFKTLNSTLNQPQDYAVKLRTFIEEHENEYGFTKDLKESVIKKKLIRIGGYFSIVTSSLMSIGMVYLIMETLATLSFITLPLPVILSMSLVCGVASYGYLTFNSLSDMIWNESLIKWYFEVKDTIEEAITDRKNIGKAITLGLGSVLLISLATCLTIFTAGTWWTIAKDLKNLPTMMKRIPKYVTQIVIPSITAVATLIFTLENTKSSLDLVLELLSNLPKRIAGYFKTQYKNIKSYITDAPTNNLNTPLYQKINPFNFLLFCIEKPLKIIGFTAHIGSVAVTTSRIPYVPTWLTVLFAFLSEFFEDLHYFFFNKEKDKACCGHDHSNDIPSKFITMLLTPLKMLSYAWHSKGTHWVTEPKDFYNAWQSTETCQRDNPAGVCQDPNCSDENCMPTSTDWQQQIILMQLSEKIEALKEGKQDDLTRNKTEELNKLKEKISDIDLDGRRKNAKLGKGYDESKNIRKELRQAMKTETPNLSKHRNFWDLSSKTNSQELKEALTDGIEALPKSHSNFMKPFV